MRREKHVEVSVSETTKYELNMRYNNRDIQEHHASCDRLVELYNQVYSMKGYLFVSIKEIRVPQIEKN